VKILTGLGILHPHQLVSCHVADVCKSCYIKISAR